MGPIDQMGKTAGFIHEFGENTVIIAVFILLVLTVIGFIIRQQQKSTEKLLEEHKMLIAKVLENNDKMMSSSADSSHEHSHSERSNDLMKEYIKINKPLKAKCKEFIENSTSTRTAIYLFHNGTHSFHGFPFFKFSCLAEHISKGSYNRGNHHNEFPVNLLGDFVENVVDTGIYYSWGDFKSTSKIDPMVYKLLSIEESWFIICGVFDTDNNILGFILCEYDPKEETNEEELNKQIEEIKIVTKTISAVLEFSEFNEKYKGGLMK